MKINYMNSKFKIFVMLSSVILFSFSANMVFAQSTAGTPILGTPIGLDHEPSDIAMPSVKTDVNGKFACKLTEGKYKLVLLYDDIASKVSRTDKNFTSKPGGYIFTLLLGQMPNVKAPARVAISRGSRPISISVAKGGGTLIGTLTYTKVR